MKPRNSSHHRNHGSRQALRIKSLRSPSGVTDRDLEESLKVAYDLAKSGGQELDIIFSSDGREEIALGHVPSPLRLTSAGLVLVILVRSHGPEGPAARPSGRGAWPAAAWHMPLPTPHGRVAGRPLSPGSRSNSVRLGHVLAKRATRHRAA